MELGLLSIMGGHNVAVFKKQVEDDEELSEIWKTLKARQGGVAGYSLRWRPLL